MTPMAITDFTASERRTLAIVAMVIDDIAPERRDAAMRSLTALRDLDEAAMDILSGAVEALCKEKRPRELLDYFCAERPLVEIQSEIWAEQESISAVL